MNEQSILFPDNAENATTIVAPAASGADPTSQSSFVVDWKAVRADPGDCNAWPGNPRSATPFDPTRSHALVEDIRTNGQQVAVIGRMADEGFFEIVAGTRRLGAVKHLASIDTNIRLFVELRELDDAQAWLVAQSENEGRRDITSIQRARSWRWAIDALHAGRQDLFAHSIATDPSVVSRTLALLAIPLIVLQALKNPEGVTVHFGERLAPSLKDEAARAKMEAVAEALVQNGVTLSCSDLLRRLLLSPAEAEAFRPLVFDAGPIKRQAVWSKKDDGSIILAVKNATDELTPKERKQLFDSLQYELKTYLGLK